MVPGTQLQCADVLTCLTNNPDFIGTLLTSANGSIVINGHNIEVSSIWMNNNITVSLGGLNGCILTVGSTTLDLCSILANVVYTIRDDSGTMIDIGNGDTLNVLGVDGMRFFVTPANTLTVGLPANRQHMQVLTRDDVNQVAYWNNNQCCAQTLSFDTATNLLSISGTNTVDLTSINTDNQELAINGNILSITQLNSGPQAVDLTNVNEHTLNLIVDPASPPGTISTNYLEILGSDSVVNDHVDLSHVNEHTLSLNGNLLSILGSDGNTNAIVDLSQTNEHRLGIAGWWTCNPNDWQIDIIIYGVDNVENNRVTIPRPEVTCCADVENCSRIQTMIAEIASLVGRVQSLENEIQVLQGQLP
jgi:hypothetical protein